MTSVPTLNIREIPLLMPSSAFDAVNSRIGALELQATVSRVQSADALTYVEELEERVAILEQKLAARVATLEQKLELATTAIKKFQKFYDHEKELWLLNKQYLPAPTNDIVAAQTALCDYHNANMYNRGRADVEAECERLERVATETQTLFHRSTYEVNKNNTEVSEKIRILTLRAEPF